MDLINHSIPQLFNGISQQAPSVRQEGQAEVQINANSSIVEGLHKRHPTNFVKVINAGSYNTNDYIHFINRDSVEQYCVRISPGGIIQVTDINGNGKTVTTPNGVAYITNSDPSVNLVAITIADYTIIVNKTKVVAMLAGSSASYTTFQEVQKFVDITYTASTAIYNALVAGRLYTIDGDNTNAFGKYYVTPNAGLTATVETVVNDILNSFDPTTMPQVLIRNADGTFTLKNNTWSSRLVGDSVSASNPSFVGRTINYPVFFRNRLGFLAGENIIFSRSGDLFNFWPKTALQVLDTDPVDVAVSNNKVSNLVSAVPFNKNLVLFSRLSQFMLSAVDILTPKTVNINQTTEFASSSSCVPVVAGSNIYFAVDKSVATSIREYFVQSYQLTYDADDVTAHVPRYLPSGITKMVASSTGDMLFAATGGKGSTANASRLYMYKYYWSGDTKVQSSWSYWDLPAGTCILGMEIIGTKLYLAIGTADGLCLEYIDTQPQLTDIGDMLVHLDRKVSLTGTYNSITGLTTWVLPYDPIQGVNVVLGDTFTASVGANLQTATRSAANTVTAIGDYSGGAVWIGIPYIMTYTFSPQYFKDQTKLPVLKASLKLKNFTVLYNNSSNFTTTVTPLGRDPYSYVFTGKSLGTLSAVLGNTSIQKGAFSFPIQAAGDTTTITITNNSPYPCFFQSAEWEGFLSIRSRRI